MYKGNIMSEYYKAQRTRNLFDPKSGEPYKLSRSALELFMNCPRCFYLDRRLGVGRPKGYPFNLNTAVDTLLKKEFDIFRQKEEVHPLIKKYGVDARPVSHEELDRWRENFKGVQFLHQPTNLLITGAIDDLWINNKEEYIVVDYKATSKDEEITGLDHAWQDGYKRQMEIYQWLLRKNGLKVSDTGYFVYCNGVTDTDRFDNKLDFEISLIAYEGDDSWVEGEIAKAQKCLSANFVPEAAPDCDYCNYISAVGDLTKG